MTFRVDLAANMIGRSNARRGARRMFAVLQNRRLNQHIAYTVVDEVGRLISHPGELFLIAVQSGIRDFIPRISIRHRHN